MRSALKFGTMAVAGTLLVASGAAAWAMGGSSSLTNAATPADPNYVAAENAVKGAKYADAVALLEKVVQKDPKNADAWNYLGFSDRKLGKYPDALAAYEKALAINPDHLGANEYLGELYLETGDMPKAQERLAKLDKLCTFGCPEYRALKAAIAAKQKSS